MSLESVVFVSLIAEKASKWSHAHYQNDQACVEKFHYHNLVEAGLVLFDNCRFFLVFSQKFENFCDHSVYDNNGCRAKSA